VFGEENALAAWMLDNAVLTFGTLVENLLHETEEVQVGDHKRNQPRFTIAQLLDPTFVFPSAEEQDDGGGWDASTWDEENWREPASAQPINLNGIVGVQGLNFDSA